MRLGTGVELPALRAAGWCASRARPAQPGRLAEHLRPIWLTPAQDRLFLEGRSPSGGASSTGWSSPTSPAMPAAVAAYERALRERMRLLADGRADAAWLGALEARLAESGAQMAAARARTARGSAGRDRRALRPALSPGRPRRSGPGSAGRGGAEPRGDRAAALAAARARDAAAGRALDGPHRGDLRVVHRASKAGRGRMLHRRAEGLDPQPRPGPGGATFACEIRNRILYCCWTRSRRTWTRPGAAPCSTKSRRSACRPS